MVLIGYAGGQPITARMDAVVRKPRGAARAAPRHEDTPHEVPRHGDTQRENSRGEPLYNKPFNPKHSSHYSKLYSKLYTLYSNLYFTLYSTHYSKLCCKL